ncbi:hypothetical protein [Streptomyces canus]|uniref:hypothetical protein n=1 Tax=Streptomyces canus TaxID=58343 RepID=UPI003249059E
MSTLEFTVLGLDSPVDRVNKTATLATGEQERCWSTPLTREHPRLAAKIFNPPEKLITWG